MTVQSYAIAMVQSSGICSRCARPTCERMGWLLLGILLLGSTALGYIHNPAWLLVLAGIAYNLVQSSLTDRCVLDTILTRPGFTGEREMKRWKGRTERPRGMS